MLSDIRPQIEALLTGLKRLVLSEYPEGYSIGEIARIWGTSDLIPSELDALLRLGDIDAHELLDRWIQDYVAKVGQIKDGESMEAVVTKRRA